MTWKAGLYCVVFLSPVRPYTSCCRFFLKLKLTASLHPGSLRYLWQWKGEAFLQGCESLSWNQIDCIRSCSLPVHPRPSPSPPPNHGQSWLRRHSPVCTTSSILIVVWKWGTNTWTTKDLENDCRCFSSVCLLTKKQETWERILFHTLSQAVLFWSVPSFYKCTHFEKNFWLSSHHFCAYSDPDNYRLLSHRSSALLRAHRNRESLVDAERCVELQPALPEVTESVKWVLCTAFFGCTQHPLVRLILQSQREGVSHDLFVWVKHVFLLVYLLASVLERWYLAHATDHLQEVFKFAQLSLSLSLSLSLCPPQAYHRRAMAHAAVNHRESAVRDFLHCARLQKAAQQETIDNLATVH